MTDLNDQAGDLRRAIRNGYMVLRVKSPHPYHPLIDSLQASHEDLLERCVSAFGLAQGFASDVDDARREVESLKGRLLTVIKGGAA